MNILGCDGFIPLSDGDKEDEDDEVGVRKGGVVETFLESFFS